MVDIRLHVHVARPKAKALGECPCAPKRVIALLSAYVDSRNAHQLRVWHRRIGTAYTARAGRTTLTCGYTVPVVSRGVIASHPLYRAITEKSLIDRLPDFLDLAMLDPYGTHFGLAEISKSRNRI